MGGPRARDKELTALRMEDMKKAHTIDPSRVMTFTSGGLLPTFGEDAKANLLPFDSVLHRKGMVRQPPCRRACHLGGRLL